MASTVRDAVTPGHAASAAPGVWLTDVSLIAMALIWGVNYSVVKYGAAVFDPLAFNSVRIAIAAVGLVAITRLMRLDWPGARTTVALLALGAIGNGVYQVLFVEGIARTRAGDAALVLAASPAFIALAGRARGVERIAGRALAGILLNIAGIALVVFGNTHTGAAAGQASLVGDLLILAGSMSWALYTVLLKPYTHDVGGLQLSTLTMLGGAVPLILVSIPALLATHWRTVPAAGWGAELYSSLISLVVAYLFYYRGIRVIGPTRAAMYGNLQPLVAVVVAWITLGEALTLWQGLGAACIMGGLLLTRA